jgi:glyoxylase-like metal-dependent hydrolase (beta-lactamase superfamily II)
MCRHAGSRRDFFRQVTGSVAGVGILDLAYRRAAWAQAMAPGASTDLFEIEKVADGVFFARARPAAVGNCNAAVFVNSRDVLVVDAHSKPSAAAGLIAQIKKEITPKPVRYLVDTHFHWDHAQGNRGYRDAFGKNLDIISSDTTKKLLIEQSAQRLKTSLDPAGHAFPSQPHIPVMLDEARRQLSSASDPQQKAQLTERIRQLEAFQKEMQNYTPELPTITFGKTHVIRDKEHDLHVEFHGRAHTAGDVVVFCPQKRAVATGDMILGSFPFMADGFPREWPKTIDNVSRLEFDSVTPGHGGVQKGREHMTGLRNYIEELTQRVEAGKKSGQTVADLQKSITVGSLKSFQSNHFGESLMGGRGGANLQTPVNTNIEHVYSRLGQV